MDQHPNKKPPRRSRASLIILIMLAFLLMIAAGILVASLPNTAEWPQETTTATIVSPEDSGFACSAAEAQQMYPFASGVIEMTANRVALLDIHGAEIYSVEVEFSAPFCVSNTDYFLAADRGGHSFVLLDREGELQRGTLDGQISSAAVSLDGHLAVVQDENDTTGVVTFFAPDRNSALFDCIFAESGYVLSVSFPEAQDCFDVTLVSTASSETRPVVKRYSFDGKQLGERKPDLTGIYPLTEYIGQDQLVLCGASNLVSMTYDTDPLNWTTAFSHIAGVRSADNGLAVLAAEDQDLFFSLYLINGEGKALAELPAGDSVNSMDIMRNQALLACGTRIILADLTEGTLIKDQDMAAEVIRAGFAADGTLTIVTRSGVIRMDPSADQ